MPFAPGRPTGVFATTNGRSDLSVPFAPGRTGVARARTDVEAFAVLEPRADGFRNYLAQR